MYTSMLRRRSSSVCPAQSKMGRLSPLTSSRENLMLLSTACICPVKASTSPVLIVTQVSSTYLNQWLGAGPMKVIKALLSTSSMLKLATIRDTGQPMAQLCLCL